jgi:DDE family transposase
MSSKFHNSQQQEGWQEVDKSDEDWNELRASRLPTDLESKAIELGAWSRQREVRSILDLLRALLALAALGYSFQRLAMWATLKGIAHMSEGAWRKRMQHSAVWITWLLCELLSVQSSPSWLEPSKPRANRILLIDATRLSIPGGTGDDVRLHWSYDLLSGRTQEVAISDRHQAEGLGWFKLQAGDITVTDAGYPAGSTVAIVLKQHADAVTRTTASHLRLETEHGERIDLKSQLKRQPYGKARHILGWVKAPDAERYQVRLVAYRLPKEVAVRAQERKRQRLREKRGKNFNQELVWWAGWILLITTLPLVSWSDEEVAQLYRARWQVELVFKRLKQGLNWHGVSIKDWDHLSTLVQLKLIVWCLQEQEQLWMREQLGQLMQLPQRDWQEASLEPDEASDQWTISSWLLTQQCLQDLSMLLRGRWSRQHLQCCLPLLQRYLLSRKRRKRTHQETTSRSWLSQKLARLMPSHAA